MKTTFHQVINCPGKGEQHDWVYETVFEGEWQQWGQGSMRQRQCLKCQEINYLEFKNKDGKITNIEHIHDLKHNTPIVFDNVGWSCTSTKDIPCPRVKKLN